MPAVDLTAPARPGVDELVDVLERHAAAADEAGRPAPEVLAALRDSPLPGLVVPKRYGGAGADALESNRMIARIARHDPSTAIIAFQHMAVCSRIAEWGSDAQRAELLPKLASGEWLAASAWSESGAGAAKKNLSTIADELPGGGWTVSGGKAFTTGAGITDVYLVLAQSTPVTDDDSAYGSGGQSFFLVPATNPGIEPDLSLDLVGMRASATGFVELKDCRLGPEALLGPRDAASTIIAGVRQSGATLGAVSAGIAEAAWDLGFQAAQRKSLLDLQAVRHRLVDLRGQVESARALVERAGRRDGADPGEVTLHSKIHASQVAEEVVASVARLLGSTGYVVTNPINRMARDARAVALMGPTNDLSRELVSLPWAA
ncbi:acyl-CoA dehydrogenase family protein [Amycolatopsis sp.]|uniref:acyl-CoA dehydrogenase family protein n=1 Tax=Amycolatopsis sp. TaxID=37632 RepID=UPI002D7E1C80|nr:acyl-CoA dehydrogenase family protein [Amycolatopsis sp.]HET6706121.1 acyl-CoA dehydrogenase family protein [Amycolatopsis sp.]